jgi:putative addiction module killer protein
MPGQRIQLLRYRTADGHVPYSDWLDGLNESTADRIIAYTARMKSGNFGNSQPVGHGVSELKID